MRDVMDTFNLIELQKELERDEGRRTKPYKDTHDIWTIGVGWNLEENPLPEAIIDQLFHISTNRAIEDAEAVFSNFEELSQVRQRVLVNMALNLGRGRLRAFKKTIKAVKHGDWERAAAEILDSDAARELKNRYGRLAKMMRDG